MTILLYPYRHTADGGRELRHSIRSMCQHGFIEHVVVVGDRPAWFTGEHVPASDTFKRKEWSIVRKVMKSPYHSFLLSSDDCFATRPFLSVPFYYSGLLSETSRPGRYAQRVENTRSLYPAGRMFDIHHPMPILRDAFIEAHARCDWENKEYLTKSVYANWLNPEGVLTEDCKIRQGVEIPDLPFFSTSDNTLVPLEKLYPNASRFEA